MHHPTDRTAHITSFVTPVVEHWLERDECPLNLCSILFLGERDELILVMPVHCVVKLTRHLYEVYYHLKAFRITGVL